MLLSIIIPNYNCEKYIEECLESCYKQNVSLNSYEVICVDDGSSDKSRRIIRKYSERYNNFRCFFQERGGVSKARNVGIENARGEYIWFIDADDFIESNIFSEIYNIILNNTYDRIKVMSYCFLETLSKNENELKLHGKLIHNYPYKNTQITRTIIRRKFINDNHILFYEELVYGEDALFNYETQLYKTKDYIYKQLCYYYRKHTDAATSVNSLEKRKNYIRSCEVAIKIITRYYNNRIRMSITRDALEYWINMLLEQYYCQGFLDDSFFWNKNSIHVRYRDFRLNHLNNFCDTIYKKNQFNILQDYCVSQSSRKERQNMKKLIRKQIIGYIKHPKRLLNKYPLFTK